MSSDDIVRRMELMDVPPGSYDEETLYDAVAEIKRLRAAGDDMATNLERIESIYHPRCAPNIAGPARIDNCACLLALAAWEEARRER